MKKLFQFKQSKRTKTPIVAAALFVAVVTGFGMRQAQVGAATVQDCTANSIIQCGAQTPAEFITKAKANNPADLQAIYTDFRFPTASYDAFAKGAKMGTAYKDGTVKVDGKTVITNAWSIGRTQFSYSTPYTIANHTYYKSAHKDVLKSDLPVMVYFDASGNAAFAVITACGNPVGGTIVKQTPPTTTPPAPTPTPTPTPAPTPTPKPVAIKCTGLQATPNAANALQYVFTASTSATNATLKGADFSYGDGSSSPNVAPSTASPSTVTITHDYAKAGTYTITATVHFVAADATQSQAIQDTTCQATITIAQATTTATVTPPAPTAPQPVTLPATGPAGVAGLFGGATALGTLGYRMRLRRKSSKADQLVDSLLQR